MILEEAWCDVLIAFISIAVVGDVLVVSIASGLFNIKDATQEKLVFSITLGLLGLGLLALVALIVFIINV